MRWVEGCEAPEQGVDENSGLSDLVEESDQAVGGKNLLAILSRETFANYARQFLGYGVGCRARSTLDGGCATRGADAWAESAE